MLILTQLFLELNIMGGLPDAVLAHAYGKILPAPSYFARVIKHFNRSPIPTLGLFQVQNVYEIMLRRRFLFFSFAYNILLILKSMENTSEILRMAQIAKVPFPYLL